MCVGYVNIPALPACMHELPEGPVESRNLDLPSPPVD